MAKKEYSLAHTKWMCKYHIVFTPKYRRKIIFNQYKADIRDIVKQLCSYKGVEIIEGHLMPDHIHTNRVLMILAEKQIQLAFQQAQHELDQLHIRTREGMRKAKESGRMAGRRSGVKIETNKAKEAKSIIKKHNKTFGGTLSNEETWTLAGISKMTFYKYKNELLKTEENS
jgi:putative transposase